MIRLDAPEFLLLVTTYHLPLKVQILRGFLHLLLFYYVINTYILLWSYITKAICYAVLNSGKKYGLFRKEKGAWRNWRKNFRSEKTMETIRNHLVHKVFRNAGGL